MWTDEEILNKFEPEIQDMTRKLPRFWRSDLQQELRLIVLQCLRTYNGQLRTDIVLNRMKDKKKAFEKLERNRGITYAPDEIDWADLEYRAKQYAYSVRHVGNATIFEKHC